MQRLYPALHDLRETRMLADFGDGQPLFRQELRRASCGKEPVSEPIHEGRRKFDQAAFVAYRKNGQLFHSGVFVRNRLRFRKLKAASFLRRMSTWRRPA